LHWPDVIDGKIVGNGGFAEAAPPGSYDCTDLGEWFANQPLRPRGRLAAALHPADWVAQPFRNETGAPKGPEDDVSEQPQIGDHDDAYRIPSQVVVI
jgi:hypothetical protein